MRYTRTAIGLLSAQYRSILKKCLMINLGLFALCAVATPAKATDYTTRQTIASGASESFGNDSFTVDSGTTDGGAVNNAGTLTLNGTTFTGNKGGYGGAVENTGTVNATGVTFTNNKSNSGFGGAIDNYAGNVTIGGTSTFSGNNSVSTGGAIANDGGSAVLTINGNVTFSGNTAVNGGAIYNAKTATISGTTFNNNSATYGGALFDAGTATVTGVEGVDTFNGNSAQYGGAVFVKNTGNTTISGTTLKENTATQQGGAIASKGTLTITDSNAEGNTAGENGGAIYVGTGTLSVTDSVFTDNHSDTFGGAVYNGDGTSISITGSTFEGNSASQSGAISDNTAATGGMNITNSTFTGNTAGSIGAVGVFSKNATSVFNNVQFISNSATTGNGGAMFVGSEGSANITNGSGFTSNISANAGGAIATRTLDVGDNHAAKLSILNTTFKGNQAATTGGAIDNSFYGSTQEGHTDAVYIAGSTFGGTGEGEGNTAANGGAIYNHAGQYGDVQVDEQQQIGKMYITNTQFINNAAISEEYMEGRGGAVYNEGTITLDGTFAGNNATQQGGGIFNYGTLTVDNSVFTGNKTTSIGWPSQGGAIFNSGDDDYLDVPSITATISNTTFGDENDATKGNQAMQGGAIANEKSLIAGEVTLTDVKFYNNKAFADTDASDGYNSSLGGAIWNQGIMTVNGESTEFKYNKAEGYNVEGGAIYNSGTLTFNDAVTFGANTATDIYDTGNGAYGGAIANSYNAVLTFKDMATFTDNKAESLTDRGTQGGAINNENIVTFEKGALFSGNEAVYGGAIFNEKTLNLTDASFTNNKAGDEGGAIFNYVGTVNINATNDDVEFSGNTANGEANDITSYGGNVNLKAAEGKTISLGGGIDGVSYRLNVNDGTAGTVEFGGDVVDANSVTVYGGTVENSGKMETAAFTNSAEFANKDGGSLKVTAEEGKIVNNEDATLTSDASGLLSDVDNAGTVILTGGTNTANISGEGDTEIDGEVENTANIEQTTLKNSGTFTTDAAKVIAAIENDGTLKLTGDNANTISGEGTTEFSGENDTNTAAIKQATLKNRGTFTTDASLIEADIENDGTLKLSGNNANAISGKGTTEFAGEVENTGNIEQATVKNGGTLTTDATLISADIINDGTLNLSGASNANNISGEGVTNISAAMDFGSSQFSGNTVNLSGGTFTVKPENFADDASLVAGKDSTIDIADNTVSLKSATFNSGSTLKLKIENTDKHGAISADSIKVDGAKLNTTLSQVAATVGRPQVYQLLASGEGSEFDEFDFEFAPNNMFTFEKVGKSGQYKAELIKTAENVAGEYNGTKTNREAAAAWVSSKPFAENAAAQDVADKLADLAQNDGAGFVDALTALAPSDAPVVQEIALTQANELFKAIGDVLSQTKGEGLASGDIRGPNMNGVSVWARAYYGESKLQKRDDIYGFDTDSKGVVLGVDKKVTPATTLGIGFGYDESKIKSFNRKDDVDTTSGFVYAQYQPSKWFVNGVVSYGHAGYDEQKRALGTTYDAHYNVETYAAQALTGYETAYFTPQIGARYYYVKRHGYIDEATQAVAGKNLDTLTGVAGVKAQTTYSIFKPELYVGMTYDLASDRDSATVSLANGSSYTVYGKRLNRFGVEVAAGITADITDKLAAELKYLGAYRKDYQNHTGIAGLKYSF